MASLLRSSLLLPPPQPMVVLSFLSLTDPFFLSHDFLILRPKWLKLSLSFDSLFLSWIVVSISQIGMSLSFLSLSLSSVVYVDLWVYGFVMYIDLGLWIYKVCCILIWVSGFLVYVLFWSGFVGYLGFWV